MFKSSEVAYLKPSPFNNKSCILGIGKGFLLFIPFIQLTKISNETNCSILLRNYKNRRYAIGVNLSTSVFKFFCRF